MPDVGFDFGLFIAYVVPGLVIVAGLADTTPRLGERISHFNLERHKVTGALLMVVVCLSVGMFVSVVRDLTIDSTFGIRIKSGALRLEQARTDLDYGALVIEGVREAYLIAEQNDKRPYQFYGNLLVSLAVIAIARGARRTPFLSRHTALITIAWLVILGLLYFSARRAHSRFAEAVTRLNLIGQQHEQVGTRPPSP